MPLRKLAERQDEAFSNLSLAQDARPLSELLAGGGDGRLNLHPQDQRNGYGCTPFPRPALLDFGSSTASSISERAYGCAQAAHAQMWMSATRDGVQQSFDDHIEAMRSALRTQLDVADAEVVFSPSGTDTQLQALYLVQALLGGPLATVIVGCDQTGSGTAHTARAQHFGDRTSLGIRVEKGAPIAGLCEEIRTLGVPFCDQPGRLRSDAETDAAVYAAVAEGAGRGEKILLQVMDASKLGWRGPSTPCIEAVRAAWPNQVCVVVDACQLRLGRLQLKDYLARGYLVMVTGSKFFTGPAFSGALLIPPGLSGAIDDIASPPSGLGSYTTRYDWPRRWRHIRTALPAAPNYGQWLRWEAALEEMRAYFSVPQAFRHGVLKAFAMRVPRLIGASENLHPLTDYCGGDASELGEEMRHRTIHAFVPHQDGKPLAPAHCSDLYRAMGRDLSDRLPPGALAETRRLAAQVCQIGQPVALRHRPGAALRISASARMVSDCWSRAATVQDAMVPVLENLRTVIEKLDWLIAHPQFCESQVT